MPPQSSARNPLDGLTAGELMTPNPLSVRDDAPLAEATHQLTDKGVSGAVVVNAAGQPVGVLSTSDILIHLREDQDRKKAAVGVTKVHEVMTPVVFSVRSDDPARKVVEQMMALNVHRLFVQDQTEVIGVISAVDVLRKMI
ncbi:MAG: HPP family protein [Gemmataceae bacterium]